MALALKQGVAKSRAYEYDGVIDRTFEVRRLRRNLLSHLHAHPHAEALGDDSLVEALAVELGIGLDEVVIQRIRVRGVRRHTLVVALSRLWHDPRGKASLFELKRASHAGGRGLVLVPETAVHRQPLLGTARTIEQAMGVRVTAEDRLSILVHLIDVGYSTLIDCAAMVKGEAPVSVVLSLVAEGAVRLSGNRLHPHVRIDLPDDGFWAR